jgi:hypothetical protein
MPNPKPQVLPGILSIDSIHAVGTSPQGAWVDKVIPYDTESDQWVYDPRENPGTSRIEVHFTFQNTGHDITSGTVVGFVDQVGLSSFPVVTLPRGKSIKDKVSFHPLAQGFYVITLSFREFKTSPFHNYFVVLARDSATFAVSVDV